MVPGKRPLFQQLLDLRARFGDAVGLTLFGRRVLILSSAAQLRELWQERGDAVTGRIPFALLRFLNPHQYGTPTHPEPEKKGSVCLFLPNVSLK